MASCSVHQVQGGGDVRDPVLACGGTTILPRHGNYKAEQEGESSQSIGWMREGVAAIREH